ncbi:MAG: hypothetical protein Q4B01_00265 [Eubacteriales bacterium]|nr:hypothetical protein [Eubacteriales bacterium]
MPDLSQLLSQTGTAVEIYLKYVGSSFHMLLLLPALLYFACSKTEREKKRVLLYYTLIFLLVYFCPLTVLVLFHFIGDTYWRMLWLLPTPVILAYAMTQAVREHKQWWLKSGLTVLFLGAIILGGKNVYLEDTPFQSSYNSEKVPQAAAVICDLIRQNRPEEERAKLAAPEDVAWYIRQIDGSIDQAYGRRIVATKENTYLRDQIHRSGEEKLNYKKLCRTLRKQNCNFVALPKGEGRVKGMKKHRFHLISSVGDYLLFRDARVS